MILPKHDEGEAFVVPQQHVVGGPETLDQLGLQEQRLGFRARRDDGHRPRLRHHPLQALRQLGDLGVVGDAVLQHARLADVEDVAAGVLHAIDTWRSRQRLQHLADCGDAGLEVRLVRTTYCISRLLLVEALGGSG